ERRPDVTMVMVDAFLTKMYRANPDFVFTVSRDFVRDCHTPILVLPDDVPAHPYAVAMESALLAPNAQVSLYPWKEQKERIPPTVPALQEERGREHAAAGRPPPPPLPTRPRGRGAGRPPSPPYRRKKKRGALPAPRSRPCVRGGGRAGTEPGGGGGARRRRLP